MTCHVKDGVRNLAFVPRTVHISIKLSRIRSLQRTRIHSAACTLHIVPQTKDDMTESEISSNYIVTNMGMN